MSHLLDAWLRGVQAYAHWLLAGGRSSGGHSYPLLLAAVTSAVLAAERLAPMRKASVEPRTARGLAYLALNYFGVSLVGLTVVFDVLEHSVRESLRAEGFADFGIVHSLALPRAGEVLVYLVLKDLIGYGIHRLLHRVPALWRIHRLHHATTEMNVLAHFTFHPLETAVYRAFELPVMVLLGFDAIDFFAAHAVAITVGHLNHANLRIPLGPLSYLLNSAPMHLLHHAKQPPRSYGVNYGLTFACWDFLFGTAYLPSEVSPDVPLGFEGVETFPTGVAALVEPFRGDPSATLLGPVSSAADTLPTPPAP